MQTIGKILARKGNTVHSVGPRVTVLEALTKMEQLDIGAVLVRDDAESVLGIFSERDAARSVLRRGLSGSARVSEVMRTHVPTASPETSTEAAMAQITKQRTRHLMVRDGETVAGIISIGDLVNATIAMRETERDELREYIGSGR